MKKQMIVALVAFIGFSMGIDAQTTTPGVTTTQVEQQKRIGEGVASGELTRRETRKLERQQRKIQHDKVEAKADGVVTPGERAKLKREQRRASARIYKEKHDAQERP